MRGNREVKWARSIKNIVDSKKETRVGKLGDVRGVLRTRRKIMNRALLARLESKGSTMRGELSGAVIQLQSSLKLLRRPSTSAARRLCHPSLYVLGSNSSAICDLARPLDLVLWWLKFQGSRIGQRKAITAQCLSISSCILLTSIPT
jgi:hypothetical protein